MNTQELLADYARNGSEAAFRELVSRYIDFVYSIALRKIGGDTHLAEDIVQQVFRDFASKARTLLGDVMLGGWLHRHTCFIASNVRRAEVRRQAREQEAAQMNTLHDDSNAQWKQLAPLLDDAINTLDGADRDAILLRFFEKRDFRSVGVALGVSDDTAQKRVSRALDKLRTLLVQRGVALSVSALGTVLADRSIASAPVGLGGSVSEMAFANAKAVGLGIGSFRKLGSLSKTALLGLVVIGLFLPAILFLVFKTGEHPSGTGASQSIAKFETGDAASGANDGTDVHSSLASGTDNNAGLNGIANSDSNVLHLTLVTADSGKPVPNVPLEMRAWENKKVIDKTLTSDRFGICKVPLSPAITEFELTTRKDGFADTKLEWRPDRGEVIPTNYTLKLQRAVQIAGRVIDEAGNPIAGAAISFQHDLELLSETRPESHQFGWIETVSDQDGRWSLNRIAKGMLAESSGEATHPGYIRVEVELSEAPEAEQQLLSGTHVFRLEKGASVRGTVVDGKGKPIADAKVLLGQWGWVGSRKTKSGNNGDFEITGCVPGKNLLTAQAQGFAPVTMDVDVDTASAPIKITLRRGTVLRLRIVNEAGAPITNAHVRLNTYSFQEGESKHANIQAEFSRAADEEGRIVWKNAPNQPLKFSIRAEGYQGIDHVVHPKADEEVITLKNAWSLVVFGTVRDSETAKPIPQFRILSGYPMDGAIHWSPIERFRMHFAGGKYRHTFNEALIGGMPNPGYVLKFEAEGYEAFVSRPIQADEGVAELNVSLKPASSVIVTLLLPNGRPAARADVGFVFPAAGLTLGEGRFSRGPSHAINSLIRADESGKFRLSADPSVTYIVVAHREGYAQVTPSDLRAHPVLELQPWGKLEGVCLRNGSPAPSCHIQFELGLPEGISMDSDHYEAKTDLEGRFAFPFAPPGSHMLVRVVRFVDEERQGTSSRDLEEQEVEVLPGQTTSVTFELSERVGHTVHASLSLQEGLNDYQTTVWLTVPIPPMPKDAPRFPGGEERWRAFIAKDLPRYQMSRTADGSWIAYDVPPGNYVVQVNVTKGGVSSGQIFENAAQIIVPWDGPESIDIGEIVLKESSGK